MQCWQLAAPRGVSCPPGEGVSREVLQSCVGAILGNCQYQAGDGKEATLQSCLRLITGPLDSLVLVCVSVPVGPPPSG